MPPNAIELPPEAAAALARGQPIRAIKLVRQATGLSLKDAKDAVEAVAVRQRRRARAPGRITGVDQPTRASAGFVFPPEAAAAVAQGKFIEAIAMMRGANPQLDLKTAQAAVDDYLHPQEASPPTLPNRRIQAQSTRVQTVMAGDSGSSVWLLVLVLVALVAILVWWLIGGT